MMIAFKFRFISLMILLTALAGCVTTQTPPPVNVSVPGPQFSEEDFKCEKEPLPPASTTDPKHQGSAAARYENGLSTWGRCYVSKTHAIYVPLKAAGQVH